MAIKTFHELFEEARKADGYKRELVTLEFFEAIGARLKALGWKRRDLARELGVSQACVSQWFKGPDLRLSTIVRLARAVGCTLVVRVEEVKL